MSPERLDSSRFIDSLSRLFYPPKCMLCRRLLGEDEKNVCRLCRGALPNRRAGLIKNNDFYSGCVAPFLYEGRVRRALLRYKFSGITAYAEGFGEFVADAVRDCLADKFDLISWAPISDRRRRSRGYDQSMLLSQAVAAQLGELAVQTLVKRRHTRPNSSIEDPSERRANVLGAYLVTDPALVRGRRVLLVDDVVTSGATLSECARTLLMAGADEVWCAAAAATLK